MVKQTIANTKYDKNHSKRKASHMVKGVHIETAEIWDYLSGMPCDHAS